jgi:hypothetical protein
LTENYWFKDVFLLWGSTVLSGIKARENIERKKDGAREIQFAFVALCGKSAFGFIFGYDFGDLI